jgi:hypothetical protein
MAKCISRVINLRFLEAGRPAKDFFPAKTPKVYNNFSSAVLRIERECGLWALNGALRKKAEVCTGLPQGPLAIDVPFCYIFSV